jgi:hypothetical protein
MSTLEMSPLQIVCGLAAAFGNGSTVTITVMGAPEQLLATGVIV